MFSDFKASILNSEYWIYTTWVKFALKYRKTFLGPLWLVVGPAMFVFFLSAVFSQVNDTTIDVFAPHLAIGYITWTLIIGFITGSSTIFQRKRSDILQGCMRLTDIVFADLFGTFLQYIHQTLVIFAVLIYFKITPNIYWLTSLLGILVLCLNGFWLSVFFGIIGARYRDLVEIISSVMRIAFFITPIIWIPKDGAGGYLGSFLVFNPFYHYLEIIRAPIMGNPVPQLSWIIVLVISTVGFTAAAILYHKRARIVALWV